MTAASAWKVASRYVARRSRTEAEVRQHLARKGFAPDEIDQATLRLQQLDLLNDRKVAQQWLAYCLSHRPVGSKRFAADMVKRGIDRKTVEEVAEQLDAETEIALARQLVQRRHAATWPRARFYRFLQYRGFTLDTADRLWRETRET